MMSTATARHTAATSAAAAALSTTALCKTIKLADKYYREQC
tara:strand:+ start:46870 stop:46992 length:123 start_codon:yes stop_codon:yes gene_type:complete